MQIMNLITIAFIPFVVHAAPVIEAELASPVNPVSFEQSQPSITKGRALFKRNHEVCQIVGSSPTVNCRCGSGTGYPVTHTVSLGSYYNFNSLSEVHVLQ
jgi:hypothetical protein